MSSPVPRVVSVIRPAGILVRRPPVLESRYLDEDISYLEFGAHVLALAERDSQPPLERIRRLADSARCLDNFFQLRGVQLRASAAGGRGRAVRIRAQELLQRQALLVKRLGRSLAAHGIGLCDWESLRAVDRRRLADVFHERFLPVLAPLATEPGQPLPAAANLTLNLAVRVSDRSGRPRFGSVELPPFLPRFVSLPDGRLVPLEQVVAAHLPALFSGFAVEAYAFFRVTRQAGPGHERRGLPVRLEVEPHIAGDTLERLVGELDLASTDVYVVHGLIGVADVRAVAALDRPDLKAPRRPAVTQRRLAPYDNEQPDLFGVVDDGDVFVHAPYDSYATSVEAFLDQAARDGEVVAIKQTLYRPTPGSPVVRALVRAAERGTHVVALVELSARLGERDSVACARALERAGAHVVDGLAGLRTHCPVALVVRRQGTAVHRYSLLSSGSHHADRAPEVMALLTADPDVGADLGDLFNYLTGYSRPAQFRTLLVGPGSLRESVLRMVRREADAGTAGRIRLKVNRVVDRDVIEALYAASQRGTPVDLVVSGACTLRPGVAGLSEGIRVVALTGRHPQTSRLFAFGAGDAAAWYLSTADLAPRNLDRQVDVAVPISDGAVRARIEGIFDACLARPAWELGPDGVWRAAGAGAEGDLEVLAGWRTTLRR